MSYKGFNVEKLFSAPLTVEEPAPVVEPAPEEAPSQKPEYFSDTFAAKPTVQAIPELVEKPAVRSDADTEQLSLVDDSASQGDKDESETLRANTEQSSSNESAPQGGEGKPEKHRTVTWRRVMKYGATAVGAAVVAAQMVGLPSGYAGRQGFEDMKPLSEGSGMTIGERASDAFDRTVDFDARQIDKVIGE